MACFSCKFWDRERAFNKNGQIRKGFIVDCNFPVSIPSNAPAAMQMNRMNWDDGDGCPVWEQFEGPVEFHSWAD